MCSFAMFAILFYCLLPKLSTATEAARGSAPASSPPPVASTVLTPVTVGVYYETHCPDSKDFIRRQLYPTYLSVGSIMRIKLVPFGKATYAEHPNGSVTFTCQHGPKECRGNMLQSCALHIFNINQTMPLIYCMESNSRPEKALDSCAQRIGLNASLISDCANSVQGERYLLEEGKATEALRPRLNFVPWITINGVRMPVVTSKRNLNVVLIERNILNVYYISQKYHKIDKTFQFNVDTN
ncbi:gamma-interferon-inducible lysosomal thiol reductase-like isoform X2 [Dinothrombium tinctorium]|uniref:Gamma-interferon-inducible lysosomal thiol reductase-like isoform X2 n=1 Tax=Dinothrombium tinctorium TaxID=1965070 RepID=A0A443QG57_9ACAR|nr:gamma-interferon-inducible lysosomal thiol reductase-like isoform X2 [Dinothrombium tinctorium]